MKFRRCYAGFVFILAAWSAPALFAQEPSKPVALAIHGGAGVIKREDMSAEREAGVRAALGQALDSGHRILRAGGTSLDAVIAAVSVLEDSPYFNAGKGAVFNHEGHNELDAAIMDGATLNAGAVAALRHIRSPVKLARAVMEKSPHVMMIGEGAEQFARELEFEFVEPGYFKTERAWQRHLDTKDKAFGLTSTDSPSEWYSTVGAVALDVQGNIAAATSTGGLNNKRFGRVGDVPVIGAGTYANNQTCAVSATGHGEYFIRSVVAYDICAQMEYLNMSLQQSAHKVVHGKLVERGGAGGIIGIDAKGNVALTFNTPGMYRGAIHVDGTKEIAIYAEP